MNRLAEFCRSALWYLIVAILLVLLIVMGTQILFRYGFNSSLIWAEEMCRYLLIWVSFLACALAYERGEVAGVTLLRDSLPRVAGILLAIVSNLLAIVLLCTLVVYGLQYAARVGSQPVPALGFILPDIFGPDVTVPSMYWVLVALPVGLAMLAVRLAVDIVLYGRMLATGRHAADLRVGAEGAG